MSAVQRFYKDHWPPQMFPLFVQFLRFVLYNNFVQCDQDIFHQIFGLAMGTPAAPDLANITLAEIETQLLSGQPQVLLFVRYIDDIFGVYKGRETEAKDAILPMYNSLNLTLTVTTSCSTVDMLDLVIFKGPRFSTQGYLDIRTHQKSMNKYLYLPARSAHPLHSQKGFFKAELQRYVVACSSHTDYRLLTNLFFKRLRSRSYPPKFLGGLFSSVRYSDRQSLLHTGTKHTSHRPPLIF
ncbi:unnamed protein product, partial [Discosporangium mesarthrocarpum]